MKGALFASAPPGGSFESAWFFGDVLPLAFFSFASVSRPGREGGFAFSMSIVVVVAVIHGEKLNFVSAL